MICVAHTQSAGNMSVLFVLSDSGIKAELTVTATLVLGPYRNQSTSSSLYVAQSLLLFSLTPVFSNCRGHMRIAPSGRLEDHFTRTGVEKTGPTSQSRPRPSRDSQQGTCTPQRHLLSPFLKKQFPLLFLI